MTRTILLLATGAAATIAITTPASVSAQALPVGPYSKTCTRIALERTGPNRLGAFCADGSGLERPTVLDISGCRAGSVRNDGGRLACDFDQRTADASAAERFRPAFTAASVVVLGRQPGDDDLLKWTMLARDYGFGSAVAARSLDFTQAVAVLKRYLAEKAAASEQTGVVVAAWRHVYGAGGPGPNGAAYVARVRAGSAWYATIVAAEQQAKTTGAK